MARRIEVVVGGNRSRSVVEFLESVDGAESFQLQRGASLKPPGDLITISSTNGAAIEIIGWFEEHSIGSDGSSSITISEPSTVISDEISDKLRAERNEGISQETESFLHKPTAIDIDTYMIMFGAGIFAAAGIITDAIHLALAGVVLAPGFQPLMLITYGVINGTREWKRGIKQTLLMYLSLLIGAILTTYILMSVGRSVTGGKATYLPEAGVLLNYWASMNFTGLFIAASAGFIGTFVVSSRQPSLLPSITIAVALIPSLSIAGIAGVAGEWGLAQTAIIRWISELILILLFSSIAFLLKKMLVKRMGNIGNVLAGKQKS